MTGFDALLLIPLIGIGIFYGLGEWWRRKLVGSRRQDTNWIVLIILLVGLVIFLYGTYSYLLSPPSIPDLTLFGYAAISFPIGLCISYLFVRKRKKYEDLSL